MATYRTDIHVYKNNCKEIVTVVGNKNYGIIAIYAPGHKTDFLLNQVRGQQINDARVLDRIQDYFM